MPDCPSASKTLSIGGMGSYLSIIVCGFFAGTMNALAGGGSFISLPALLAAGIPSVQANASSTVALFPGGLASAWTYWDGTGFVGPARLRSLLLTTVGGGVIGALLLLRTPSSLFDLVLPWLLLAATIALNFGSRIGHWLSGRWRIRARPILFVQFVLGMYGGYFGGAVGIMMMAVWSLLDRRDLKSMNSPRTLLVSAANVTGVIIFIAGRVVHWPQTVVMLVAAGIGGYSGARIGRGAPPRVIRVGTLCITGAITAAFFIRAYAISR